ncbi:hypothetical protein NKY68_00240 [Sinorhizobium meliloti]|uniref:hypothetical protein n=1 Tax=Rhizobium meliloti TaxID=382 RepID=UPI003D6579A7
MHQCGGEYTVDPIKDLIPVCANCHAMLHRRSDPLTVEELRAILVAQREIAAGVPQTIEDFGTARIPTTDRADDGLAF